MTNGNPTTPCRGGHLGPCTTGPTYTQEAAEAELVAMGYTLDEATSEWVLGEVRGQLIREDDHCHPWSGRGTAYVLELRGAIPILPTDEDRDALELIAIATAMDPDQWETAPPPERALKLLARVPTFTWDDAIDHAADARGLR